MPRKGERGMMWQRALSPDIGDLDPEHEQELRLVAQARAGAAWALSALVARYQPPVVRYLVRLTGDPELGRTLAEQVLVRMAKRVRGPHGGEHLRLWLLRTCTEVGLDTLRNPQKSTVRRLEAPQSPVALIAGRVGGSPMGRWVAGWSTRLRQPSAPRPPVRTQQFVWQTSAETTAMEGDDQDQLTPREALKLRMIRAVLAELPYGDAQCLSLHLVAGLNQSEVALALGVTPNVARRRVVQGLQLFGRRYDAALASLGLPPDFDIADEPTSAHAEPLGLPTSDLNLAVEDAPRAELAEPSRAALAEPGSVGATDVVGDMPLATPTSMSAPAPTAPATDVGERGVSPEEAALTSAEIMAYLRAAAARDRENARAAAAAARTYVDAEARIVDPATQESVDEIETPAVGAEAQPVQAVPSVRPLAGEGLREDVRSERDDTPHAAADERLTAAIEAEVTEIAPTPAAMGREAAAEDDMLAEAGMLDMPVREGRIVPILDPARPVRRVPVLSRPHAHGEFAAIVALAVPEITNESESPETALAGHDGTTAQAEPPESMAAIGDRAIEDDQVAGTDAPTDAQDGSPNALPDALPEAPKGDDSDYLLVVDPETSEDATQRTLRARRKHVLSVDGEAEDPGDSGIWPLS